MAQHNCEDLNPTDSPHTVPTFTKAKNCHLSILGCAHNPFACQVDQDNSISMVSPCPQSEEQLLKESAGDIKEVDYPVNWIKFISIMHSKTQITEPSIPGPTPVHVAYSPLASMKHQWTTTFH